LPYSSTSVAVAAGAATAAGHNTLLASAACSDTWRMPNRHATRVSGSDSYASLFLYNSISKNSYVHCAAFINDIKLAKRDLGQLAMISPSLTGLNTVKDLGVIIDV